VWIGHVGDSRAYLVRDGALSQITEDHSLVAELVKNGKLSPEEAETHPQRSVITRALGTDSDVDVDVFEIEPHVGDVFLIVSDGLTSMVDDETILGLVEQHRDDLDAAARALVNAANRGGGEDNITVVAFDIADPAAAPLDETLQMPAQEEPRGPEDEDTLTEVDAVPVVDPPARVPSAVDTMVVPPGSLAELSAAHEESAAEAAQQEGRQSPARQALGWLLVLAVALVCAALIWVLTH
jgi:protein phosphatase